MMAAAPEDEPPSAGGDGNDVCHRALAFCSFCVNAFESMLTGLNCCDRTWYGGVALSFVFWPGKTPVLWPVRLLARLVSPSPVRP